MGAHTDLLWVKRWTKTRPGWDRQEVQIDGAAFHHVDGRHPGDVLIVVVSGARELDGKRWIHVSASRRFGVPTYEDLCFVKQAFIGDDRKAITVMPARAEHVNIHPNCLHLWHCVDGDPLPDFTQGSNSI